MARPITWLPRLHEIRRSVTNSVRSHYSTRDLGLLFKLQARSVTKLLKVLPVELVGQNHMVKREELVAFLDKAKEAEDVSGFCAGRRSEREAISRRKPRELVRRDFDHVDPASLAPWMTRGKLEVEFRSAQELFDALWRVASVLQEDLEEFIRLYDPEPPPSEELTAQRSERDSIQAEIEAMRARWEEKMKSFLPSSCLERLQVAENMVRKGGLEPPE